MTTANITYEMSVKEARGNFAAVLDSVEKGEDVIITRRGKQVAIISHLPKTPKPLQSLKAFRANISVSKESLSQSVIAEREQARY